MAGMEELMMTAAEWRILGLFRRYRVRPAEMLFVNFRDCRVTARGFVYAMRRLMAHGFVVKEHPRQAYSLTRAGYEMSRKRRASTGLVGSLPACVLQATSRPGSSARRVRHA
jgi:hypothetical protein